MDLSPVPAGSPAAVAALRSYLADIIARYHGRPATEGELRTELAGHSPGDLDPPRGAFLLARYDGHTAGCAGVRLTGPQTAELTRLWVHPGSRRTGLGARLVTAAEAAAQRLGAHRIRLDTRNDLREARNLYARAGYAEIAPYHHGPYADHFFEKQLTP